MTFGSTGLQDRRADHEAIRPRSVGRGRRPAGRAVELVGAVGIPRAHENASYDYPHQRGGHAPARP